MVMNREKREGSDGLCIWMRRGTPRSTGIYQCALKGCCFVLSLRAFPILKVSQTNVLENHISIPCESENVCFAQKFFFNSNGWQRTLLFVIPRRRVQHTQARPATTNIFAS